MAHHPSGGLGGGNSTVTHAVAPNYGPAPRSATLTVAGHTVTVTQGALQVSTLSLNPTSVLGENTSTGTVTLNAPAPAIPDKRTHTTAVIAGGGHLEAVLVEPISERRSLRSVTA